MNTSGGSILYDLAKYWLSSLMCVLLISPTQAADKVIKWSTLTTEDGLSQNSVYAILQDSDGFMWFGTRFGLNRYDGKTFKTYIPDAGDTLSIPSFKPTALCEDNEGNLWIGTMDAGIARFNKQTETFIRFQYDPDDDRSLISNHIEKLYVDTEGTLWIGSKEGLCRYNAVDGSFEQIRLFQDRMVDQTTRQVMAISEFPNGTLWVGTENAALLRMSLEDMQIEVIREPEAYSSTYISCLQPDTVRNCLWVGYFGWTLFKYDSIDGLRPFLTWEQSRTDAMIAGIGHLQLDRNGELWIATAQAIVRHDPDRLTFDEHRADPNQMDKLQDDGIYSLYIDPQGNVWVGTEAGGVSKYSPGLIRFKHIQAEKSSDNSLLANGIFSIEEDSSGNIWFGTTGGGVCRYDQIEQKYTSFTSDDSKVNWSRNFISKILPIGDEEVWLGTFRCGLFHLDRSTETFTLYRNEEDNPNSLRDHTIYALLLDSQETLWIGTQSQGLERFNPEARDFTHFQHNPLDPSTIASNFIFTLMEDHEGFIWVGTSDNGISRMNKADETFTHIHAHQDGNMSLSSNIVLALYEDPNRNIWVGTRGGGLNRINPSRTKVEQFDLGDGTETLTISGILQDDHGYLWLSTRQGIFKVHPDHGVVRNFTSSDGVLREFYNESSLKVSDGTMYFGGINGYNQFHPDSIRDNQHIPPIVLTEISINYQSLDVGDTLGDSVPLTESITFTRHLTFEPDHRTLRFNFAALDYYNSEKNKYAYIMDGYDREWIHSGTDNTAQYMNLPPGDYTFRVRGTNNDGVWNEEGIQLSITILPPFWRTLWFRTAASLFLLALITFYIRLRTAKIKAEQVKLERLVRERTEQLRKEMEDRQRLEIEQTHLKADHLKRELLTQSLHLNDKQQIMEDLHNELEVVCEQKPDEAKSRLKKLQRFLKDKISVKEGWEEFEHWFRQVHTGFYSTLRENFPELSESELKVCALLRLKMSSKDIARVMNVQPPSVDIYRHRIRKKLDLTGDDNLSSFLGQY